MNISREYNNELFKRNQKLLSLLKIRDKQEKIFWDEYYEESNKPKQLLYRGIKIINLQNSIINNLIEIRCLENIAREDLDIKDNDTFDINNNYISYDDTFDDKDSL